MRNSFGRAAVYVYVLVFSAFLLAGPLSLCAQNTPGWLHMLDGKEAFARGNYGIALSHFRKIAERDPSNPDALLWIGYVFEAEGEFELALRKYRQALDNEKRFSPYQERIAARYALARVLRKMGRKEESLSVLQEIITEMRSGESSDALLAAMQEKMRRQGPDKVLELYRVNEKPVRLAYSLLGEQALLDGDYDRSIAQYTVSFAVAMTTAIEGMKEIEADYLFMQEELPVSGQGFYLENTRRFLAEIEEVKPVCTYLDEIGFYRELFFFAAALHGSGRKAAAKELWLLIKEHRESGIWSSLAREQAAEPDLSVIPALSER